MPERGGPVPAELLRKRPHCTQSIVDFIVQIYPTEMVPLGYSHGGTIISKAIEQIPGLIAEFVFWNAFAENDRDPPRLIPNLMVRQV